MNDITVLGNICVDYLKEINYYPNPGNLAHISSISRSIGGCVGNTLLSLAAVDSSLKLRAGGYLSNDENGEFVRSFMSAHGIDMSLVGTCETPSSFTDVMTVKSTGDRTFFYNPGSSAVYDKTDAQEAQDTKIFHVGYAMLLDGLDAQDEQFGTKMAKLLCAAGKKGALTSLDCVSAQSDKFREIVEPSLKYCDYLIINEVEAAQITGIPTRDENGVKNLKANCEELMKMGVRKLVAIHTPEVGCALEPDGTFTVVGSYIVPEGYIVGSVGAGDAFCAGMLYSLLRGKKIEDCLKFANGTAATSLAGASGAEAVKPAREIEKIDFPIKDVDMDRVC